MSPLDVGFLSLPSEAFVEAFRFTVDFSTTTTSQTVGLADDSDSFHSSGVSIDTGTDEVSVPAGVWLLGANVSVDVDTATPTSGELSLRLSPSSLMAWEYIGFVDYADVAAYAITPTISGSVLVDISSSTDLTLDSYNGMDEDAYLYGSIWGFQINASVA